MCAGLAGLAAQGLGTSAANGGQLLQDGAIAEPAQVYRVMMPFSVLDLLIAVGYKVNALPIGTAISITLQLHIQQPLL